VRWPKRGPAPSYPQAGACGRAALRGAPAPKAWGRWRGNPPWHERQSALPPITTEIPAFAAIAALSDALSAFWWFLALPRHP
jgi:hypothetical protein